VVESRLRWKYFLSFLPQKIWKKILWQPHTTKFYFSVENGLFLWKTSPMKKNQIYLNVSKINSRLKTFHLVHLAQKESYHRRCLLNFLKMVLFPSYNRVFLCLELLFSWATNKNPSDSPYFKVIWCFASVPQLNP